MNSLIKLALLRSIKKNQGFAFPLALLIGFIMLGTGVAMIAKSQGDQSRVLSQKMKADGLGLSEVGVSQLQALLYRHRLLSLYDSANWATGDMQSSLEEQMQKEQTRDCPIPQDTVDKELETIESIANSEWQELNSDSKSGTKNYYRLISYDYQATEGRALGPKDAINQAVAIIDGGSGVDQSQSKSRISVNIGILSQREPLFPRYNAANQTYENPYDPSVVNVNIPGLWIKEGATDDAQYPLYPENGNYAQGAHFDSYVLMSERCQYDLKLRKDIAGFIRDAHIHVVQPEYDARFVLEEFPALPAVPTDLPTSQTDISLNTNATFPRPGDVATSKKTLGYTDPNNAANNIPSETVDVYEYIVNSINLSTSEVVTITSGQKVIFYVRGNINIASGAGLTHDCSKEAMEAVGATTCRVTDFQIFADNSLGVTNPQICLRNNSRKAQPLPLEAFIFAPDYKIGKTGNAQFIGAIWGKSWGKIDGCGSVNANIAVEQRGEWGYLYHNLSPAEPLPSVGKIEEWKQLAIDDVPASKVDQDINQDTDQP